jgi:hypothetical protein
MPPDQDDRQVLGLWPFALSEELRRNYDKAIYYFEKAILASQNDEKIKDYRQDIERCQMKTEIWKTRHAYAKASGGV